MPVRRPLAAVAAALAVLCAALLAPPAAQAAAPAVTAGDIDGHLRALAGIAAANGGNRAAGLPGADATADYLAARLREAGWQVTEQPVTFPFSAERSAPVLGDLRPGRDFVAARLSGSGDATGRVRTILAERCSPRSLRRLKAGEIALIPLLECTPERAAQLVRARGGVGIVYDGGPDLYPLRPALESPASLPILVARTSAALRLSRARTPVRIRADLAVDRRTARNVVAELPRGRRVVMAGGHLDSVPEGAGLNDNGSGLAALLEIAERLPAENPRATLRIGFWTAEENGLFGSAAYVEGLSRAERARIAAYVNLDMVGSPNPVVEVYDSDDGLEELMRDALPGREGETPIFPNSDHAAFAEAGVPVSGVYTGGLEKRRGRYRDRCYHRVCDGVDNVDRGTAAKVATGTGRALARLAARR